MDPATPHAGSNRRYLGEILVDSGLIDQPTLDRALELSRNEGKKVGRVLVEMGVADEVDIARALSDQLSIPFVHLKNRTVPKPTLDLVSTELVKNYNLLPIDHGKSSVTVVMANPLDFYAVDDVRFATQLNVELAIAPEHEILDAIHRHYPEPDTLIPSGFGAGDGEGLVIKEAEQANDVDAERESELLDLSAQHPVIRFTNAVISDAIRLNASDVHIEPQRNAVHIRYRIDGVMREVMRASRNIHSGVVTRIKVMASLDITVRRAPQDGKFQAIYNGSRYDLRVSTLPTTYGEKVTIRILSQLSLPGSVEELGFSEDSLADLLHAIRQPQGIVLLTGPTGSGKTTTLYTCLRNLLTPEVNIITLENPVEYDIEGINQVEITPKTGLTFANGMRSILRQDPDIILLGEIRDHETAEIAFQAAQTGHLVLSTLHTNSAAAAIDRLVDLGIDTFTIGSSLNAVIGQRLVRRLCEQCKAADPSQHEELGQWLTNLPHSPEGFWTGTGCSACGSTGYSGRLGIHEVMRITSPIQALLNRRANSSEIQAEAIKSGYMTISMDGIRKAAMGLTSVSEVYRVAPPLSDDSQPENLSGHVPVNEEVTGTIPEQPQQVVAVTSVAPRRILVADTDDASSALAKGVFEGEGYKVLTARDGYELLAMANREIPDLVLADTDLQGMDGFECIKHLKSSLTTVYIPVILMATTPTDDHEAMAIGSGADDFMKKPLNPVILTARVNRLLERQLDH